MTRAGRDRGFTLVEVLVALLIGSMAVAGATALFLSLSDHVDEIEEVAARVDRQANGERLLRALAANLRIGDSIPLAGDSRSALFQSWCETPSGWLKHCTVRLSLRDDTLGTTVALSLTGPYMATSIAVRLPRRARFRYLQRVDLDLQWVDTWSRRDLPQAIVVTSQTDTLLLTVQGDG